MIFFNILDFQIVIMLPAKLYRTFDHCKINREQVVECLALANVFHSLECIELGSTTILQGFHGFAPCQFPIGGCQYMIYHYSPCCESIQFPSHFNVLTPSKYWFGDVAMHFGFS